MRWHALKTDCKWPARHGEAEARGSFVIRELRLTYLRKAGNCGILILLMEERVLRRGCLLTFL